MAQPATAPLGDLDGEAIDKATAKLAGAGVVDRRFGEGEAVIVVAFGIAGLPTIKRVDGELIRVQPVKVDRLLDLGDEEVAGKLRVALAELKLELLEAARRVADDLEGIAVLPFDVDEEDLDSAGIIDDARAQLEEEEAAQ